MQKKVAGSMLQAGLGWGFGVFLGHLLFFNGEDRAGIPLVFKLAADVFLWVIGLIYLRQHRNADKTGFDLRIW